MFSKKESKSKDEPKSEPKSPSVLRTKEDHLKHDKWKQQEQAKADKMARKALEEEESSILPLAVRQLESCPAPTRRHTQFLLSGYLAVKTSGGWTRKWQTRFVVLTPTALYVYKRPPSPTLDTYTAGPEISLAQSRAVTASHAPLEKEMATNDTITVDRLSKLMATADTTDDGSHELFGLVRESIPIAQSTMVMEVPQIPHTFCLTFPDTPRLLLRAANYEQFKLWQYTIQSTIILQTYPPHMISQVLAKKSLDENKDLLHLIPHIEDMLPIFVDRAAIISQVSFHHSTQSLYSDASILNKDPNNGEASPEKDAAPTVAPKLIPANIVNSTTMNSQVVQQQTINLNACPSQGNIITNLTPWGQKVNIVLNQLPNTIPSTTVATSAAVAIEQSIKDNSITIQLADGGYVTIPLDHLYDLYKQHKNRIEETKKYSSVTNSPQSPEDENAPAKAKFSEHFADSLFTVSNSLYNADIHIGFRFTTYPASRKDPGSHKGKKMNPKQLAQLKSQQEQALEQLKQARIPPINAFGGLISLIMSCYIAFNLHKSFTVETPSEIATLWLSYLVLTVFTMKMANISFNFTRQRKSLQIDSDAIAKIVNMSGFQQAQLHDPATSSSPSSSALPSHNDNIPVLEIIPIRIVDRHTITGAVLLGGSKYDHESFPPLPIRTTHTPQISLLKALHSTTTTSGPKAAGHLTTTQTFNLDDDDFNADDSSSEGEPDSEDDTVFETDPTLGKIYVEEWGKWCQADYRGISLRGPDYLTNKKKIKIPALPHRFQSCYTAIMAIKEYQPHCARWNNSYFRKQRQKAIDLGKGDMWKKGTPLKYMIINMLVPGSPNYNFVMYMRNPYIYPSPYPEHIQQGIQQEYHPSSPNAPTVVYPGRTPGEDDPFARLLENFVKKDDAYRKAHFKYIPNVAEGPWIVKRTVGQTPVILGNKLTQTYYVDPHEQYVEIDIDVGSSSMAGSILGMVKGYAKQLSIDMSFLLEPHEVDELPEALWGGCRIINVDLFAVSTVEVTHGSADD